MDGVRDWRLLSSVVPSFLELEKFYIGNDEEAVAARAEIDR